MIFVSFFFFFEIFVLKEMARFFSFYFYWFKARSDARDQIPNMYVDIIYLFKYFFDFTILNVIASNKSFGWWNTAYQKNIIFFHKKNTRRLSHEMSGMLIF